MPLLWWEQAPGWDPYRERGSPAVPQPRRSEPVEAVPAPEHSLGVGRGALYLWKTGLAGGLCCSS